MGLIDNVKAAATTYLTKPTIDNVHNGEENVSNIVIAEGDSDQGQYQQTYYPNANFSFYNGNKFVSAVSSGNDRSLDIVDPRSGDVGSFGRIGGNFQRNGVGRFQIEQQESIKKMVAARQTSDVNHVKINSLTEVYPESDGWVLSDAGAKGVIATNGILGTYGIINNEGDFIPLRA